MESSLEEKEVFEKTKFEIEVDESYLGIQDKEQEQEQLFTFSVELDLDRV